MIKKGKNVDVQSTIDSFKKQQVGTISSSFEKQPTDILAGKKNMPQGEFIEIEVIDLEPFRNKGESDFSAWNESDFEELVISVAQYGIMQPLIVRPINQNETKFEILSGEHRWKAAKQLEKRHVPCRIYRCDDDSARSVFAFTNLITRELTLSDKITWGSKYFEMTKGKRKDVIDELKKQGFLVGAETDHFSKKQLSRYYTINSLPTFLADLVKNGVIPIVHGLEFSKFSPEELDLLEEFDARITSAQVAIRVIKLQTGQFEGYVFDEKGLRFATDKRRTDPNPKTFNYVVNHAKEILKTRIKKEDYVNAPQILTDALDMYSEFGADKDIIAKALAEYKSHHSS